MKRFWNYHLPLALVLAYRLVPASVRGHYPFFGKGPSSSHLAVQYLRQGWGWSAVRAAVWVNGESNRPGLP
jgi:hypothetical protein